MPKISDERRAERRRQILDAARTCFERQGPHATTMDDIIKASGLSSGAVYGYFRSKDELVVAALTASLAELGELLELIFQKKPSPEDLVQDIAKTIVSYSLNHKFDLKRVAVQGWAEAQRNMPLRSVLRQFYFGYRDSFVQIAGVWKQTGVIDSSANPDDVAKALLALFFGFVAQDTLLGDVEPSAISRGMRDLITTTPGSAKAGA